MPLISIIIDWFWWQSFLYRFIFILALFLSSRHEWFSLFICGRPWSLPRRRHYRYALFQDITRLQCISASSIATIDITLVISFELAYASPLALLLCQPAPFFPASFQLPHASLHTKPEPRYKIFFQFSFEIRAYLKTILLHFGWYFHY